MSKEAVMEGRNALRYISKLSSRLKREMDACNTLDDLSGSQVMILRFVVSSKKKLCQKDLEDEYSIRPASISELLNALEKKGYITREENPNNRRMKFIIPTQKALDQKERIVTDLAMLEETLIKPLSKEQYDNLLTILESLLAITENY